MTAPRGRQRAVLFAAILALVLAFVGVAAQFSANAALPNNPYSCGPNDANRMTLNLSGGGSVTPCISGVQLELTIPDNTSQVRGYVSRIRSVDTQPLIAADGTQITNVVHISFDSFSVSSVNTGVLLKTSAGAAGSPAYTLTGTPDHDLTIGGNGVTTDMWVDANSWIRVNDNLLGAGCVLLQFALNPCKIPVWEFASLSWLLNGSSYSIYGMDLKFYFLTTYKTGGGIPTGSSIQLPNTSLTVS